MRNSLSIFQKVFWWQEWWDYYFLKIPIVLEFLKRPKLVGKSGQFVSKKLAQKMKRKSQNGKVRKTIPIILSHKRSVNLRKSFDSLLHKHAQNHKFSNKINYLPPWRDFKINCSRPLFTIIFSPKMVFLDTDSILRVKTMYESVK